VSNHCLGLLLAIAGREQVGVLPCCNEGGLIVATQPPRHDGIMKFESYGPMGKRCRCNTPRLSLKLSTLWSRLLHTQQIVACPLPWTAPPFTLYSERHGLLFYDNT
jgi:hypothetical protein